MLLSSQEDQVLLHLWERTGVTQLRGGPGSPSPVGEGRCYSAHRRTRFSFTCGRGQVLLSSQESRFSFTCGRGQVLLSSQEDQVLLHLRERAGVTQLTGGPGSPSPVGEDRCYSAHRRAGSPSPAGEGRCYSAHRRTRFSFTCGRGQVLLSSQEDQVLLHLRERPGVTPPAGEGEPALL